MNTLDTANEELNTINEQRINEQNNLDYDELEAERLSSLEKMAEDTEDQVPAEQGCF